MVTAWRAEFVAYQSEPAPQMVHLGDAFSLDLEELQRAVRTRAREIADSLADGDKEEQRAAEVFRSWSIAVAPAEQHQRLLQGEALVRSFAAAGCIWELSLRPVTGSSEGG